MVYASKSLFHLLVELYVRFQILFALCIFFLRQVFCMQYLVEFCTFVLLWSECLYSPITCWNTNASVMVFESEAFQKWLSQESRILMNEVSALIKPQRTSQPFPPCKDTIRNLKIRRAFIQSCWSSTTLIMDLLLPTSRTVRNTLCIVCKPPSRWYFSRAD